MLLTVVPSALRRRGPPRWPLRTLSTSSVPSGYSTPAAGSPRQGAGGLDAPSTDLTGPLVEAPGPGTAPPAGRGQSARTRWSRIASRCLPSGHVMPGAGSAALASPGRVRFGVRRRPRDDPWGRGEERELRRRVAWSRSEFMGGACWRMFRDMAQKETSERPRTRYGITVPFDGVTLEDHRGGTPNWSDSATPTVVSRNRWIRRIYPSGAGSAWSPSLNLGVATIIPAYTRGPALLAQSVLPWPRLPPVGSRWDWERRLMSSSAVGTESLSPSPTGGSGHHPVPEAALASEKVDNDYPTFAVHGFRLARPVENPPPIFLAALRPGMLKLAGREADARHHQWLSARMFQR